jgi:hypothetical protein
MSTKLNALNAGQVLGRSEMKKIMAGSGGNGDCSCNKLCPINEWPLPCPGNPDYCGECAGKGESGSIECCP